MVEKSIEEESFLSIKKSVKKESYAANAWFFGDTIKKPLRGGAALRLGLALLQAFDFIFDVFASLLFKHFVKEFSVKNLLFLKE